MGEIETDLSQSLALVEESAVKALLTREALRQYRQGAMAKREIQALAAPLIELSDYYTGDRRAFRLSSEHVRAYAFYYLPVNFAKIRFLLERLPKDFPKEKVRVLDFGCGPGTASLAVLTKFPHGAEITAVDKAGCMLSAARKIVRAYGQLTGAFSAQGLAGLHWSAGRADEVMRRTYDLIVAANVLNEAPLQQQKPLLERLCGLLADRGVLMILEPGTHKAARNLMALRDLLARSANELVPVFPCTRADDCPMLKNSAADWCHAVLGDADKLWRRSRLISQIDALAGFNKHRIKYSAFMFQKHGRIPEGWRVIRPLRKTGRRLVMHLCGPGIFGEVSPDPNRPASNLTRLKKLRQFALINPADL